MTVAEYLAEKLKSIGVKYIFGIPGGSSIPYIEAYRNAGIEYILVSNEASAGVMAAVSSRLTGVPGICHATFGPGATNLSSGVGGALLDRESVIALTDEIEENMTDRTVQMNIDHQALYGPISKATFRLNPANAPEIIEKALAISRQEYPGPVHIGLPANIANEQTFSRPGQKQVENAGAKLNNETDILSLIQRSEHPLLAFGLTSARLLSSSDLDHLVSNLNIPVVVTPMAKGLISESHPCYAGVLFHALSRRLKILTDNTDLVIGIGYDPVEYNYESWMPDVPLIHFNTIENDLPDHIKAVRYISPPEEWIKLLGRIEPGNKNTNCALAESVRHGMSSTFGQFTGKFGPVTAVRVLQEELPKDVILTADVGSHLHVLGQYWKTNGNKNLIMTNGWSGMGFGIPAAIAVKFSKPSSTVVCVTGDGGFLMIAGEIITARRYHLALIVVVFSDRELNLIRLKKTWHGFSPYGTSLYSGDLFESDSFLGVKVLRAVSENEMRKAINSALKLNEPVIINATIDPEDYSDLISGNS
jgi:acetolactate synthase-1/2/3 large subunit